MVFVNNNVRTYENLYIRKIKIRNILETKYSRFTVLPCKLEVVCIPLVSSTCTLYL